MKEKNQILFSEWGPRTEHIGYAVDDFRPMCVVETSRKPITLDEHPMLIEYKKSVTFWIVMRYYENEVYDEKAHLYAEEALLRMIAKPFLDKAYEVRRAILSREFEGNRHAIEDLIALMTKGQSYVNEKTETRK